MAQIKQYWKLAKSGIPASQIKNYVIELSTDSLKVKYKKRIEE